MPLVSANWLARHTGKDWRTIKKRIDKLSHDNKGRVDCASALESIYCGDQTNGNGEFIPTPEAVRQLTIAKKQEIDLEMEIKRRERIPLEDCVAVDTEILQAVAGLLKANRDKPLSDSLINELFGNMREWSQRFEAAA